MCYNWHRYYAWSEVYMQINIGFGVNDGYVQHLGVLMTSILYNSSLEDDYTFYIVSDYISDENKAKFEELKNLRPFELKYIDVDVNEYESLKNSGHLGASTYFRYQLFKLEEIDKILYLDADMICRKDIRELFEIDLGSNLIGGAEDVLSKTNKKKWGLNCTATYINAGMILINLNKTRDIDLFKLSTTEIPLALKNLGFNDQDMINYIFQDQISLIDIKWNYCYPFGMEYDDREYYLACSKDPSLIHWISWLKPWTPGLRNAHMKEEYFKYLKMSPWNNPDWFIDYIIEGNAQILENIRLIHEKLDIKSKR